MRKILLLLIITGVFSCKKEDSLPNDEYNNPEIEREIESNKKLLTDNSPFTIEKIEYTVLSLPKLQGVNGGMVRFTDDKEKIMIDFKSSGKLTITKYLNGNAVNTYTSDWSIEKESPSRIQQSVYLNKIYSITENDSEIDYYSHSESNSSLLIKQKDGKVLLESELFYTLKSGSSYKYQIDYLLNR